MTKIQTNSPIIYSHHLCRRPRHDHHYHHRRHCLLHTTLPSVQLALSLPSDNTHPGPVQMMKLVKKSKRINSLVACFPTMSSLQRRFGLPADLTPSVCHSVLLIVHLSSFIRAMCPAHFDFVLVTYWTMSVTLVLCLMVVLRILSSSLTLSILLSIAL